MIINEGHLILGAVRVIVSSIVCVIAVATALGQPSSEPRKTNPDEGFEASNAAAPITKPLRVSSNPNYFEDSSGHPIVLCGSQTWNTLQDWGTNGTTQATDFDTFVRLLELHGHNFTLLWFTELPKFSGLPVVEKSPPDFTVSPFPWQRTGPGMASDGKPKFDLTKYDTTYFHRLRERVEKLDRAGIYAGVYLFTGEWQLRFRSATDGYAFTGSNNVNGIDDGYRGGAADTGLSSVTMTAPNDINQIQDAYVRRTIDTLNDLPNVLWIVSEEAPVNSMWWNNHLISLVKDYERKKRFQHPVGFAAPDSIHSDSVVYDSDADWVAPVSWLSPPRSCGSGNPPCKVNINDSDHSYFGMWNDTLAKNCSFAWENFTNGNQVLFMDPYLVDYPRQGRNHCTGVVDGIGSTPDPRWDNFRDNLGYIIRYSRRLDLAKVTAQPTLSSTGFCLAQTPPKGAEYLVYAPSETMFTVDLSAMPTTRQLSGEWFEPATGETLAVHLFNAGSPSQKFTSPFASDAVLYLVDTAGHH